MGFKADNSFLRFLTMGAIGVHQTKDQLKKLGFEPIELERYCGSNKIWATKVKRLRLPDLLCVKTGLRIEVRSKSKLAMKMSDAPENPERAWDAGLEDNDLVAFIACFDNSSGPTAADKAMFVRVGEMRAAVAQSKLGAPKSVSEGAERDREWPTIVPNRDGKVIEVTDEKIVVYQSETTDKTARRQTYQLKGRTPYVQVGTQFNAGTIFLAGTPARLTNISDYKRLVYDPFKDLNSKNKVERYSAVKSFPYRNDNKNRVIISLEEIIREENDDRIKLEAAGSATYFGSELGKRTISEYLLKDDSLNEMRMESIFILVELGPNAFTKELLNNVAGNKQIKESEIRQAAIWGLGKAGFKDYASILPYIDDQDENVALHAIAAFDEHTPDDVIKKLIMRLQSGQSRLTAAASETLLIIGSSSVVKHLVHAYDQQNESTKDWIIATLGRMNPKLVRTEVSNPSIRSLLEPFFLNASGSHWLSYERITTDISFLLKQNVRSQ